MEQAKIYLSNKEYSQMVQNISSSHQSHELWNKFELKFITKQMVALFNIFLSIGAVFTAVYYFGDSIVHDVGLVNYNSWLMNYCFLENRVGLFFSLDCCNC